MLKKDYKEQKFIVICDQCEYFEYIPVDNQEEASDHLKKNDWYLTKYNDNFEHYCPKCLNSKSKRIQKKIKQRKKSEIDNSYESKAPEVIYGGCKTCGGDLVIRESKYGKFYGCSRYPKCNTILKLEYVVKNILNKKKE